MNPSSASSREYFNFQMLITVQRNYLDSADRQKENLRNPGSWGTWETTGKSDKRNHIYLKS